MKRIKILSAVTLILVFVMTNACKESFLEITPNGSLSESVLATYEGVDGLLIGAYSLMDGQASGFGWESATSGWVFGSIRGMEANKGTDSGDQPEINPLQTYSESPSNGYLNVKWRALYEGVSRCNATIVTAIAAQEAETITADEATSFIKQSRALRGFYHLEAWRLWADRSTNTGIPYVDENTDQAVLTNTEDVRASIIADLTEGTSLPLDMGQVGRFNKTVSQVLLAKALMQMNGDYATAKELLSEVVASGTNPAGQEAGLEEKYGDIFDAEYRNGVESIYTVQYSVNDGSGGNNGGNGEVLNFPYKGGGGSPGGCCGFFNPTQDFVNSFQTDANGLPFLDNSYNTNTVNSDQGVVPSETVWKSDGKYLKDATISVIDPATPFIDRGYKSLIGTDGSENIGNDPLTSPGAWELVYFEEPAQLDPRLDWSVGRRGIPYWDWGLHTGQDWIRDQTYSGPYNSKKQVYKKSQEGTLTEVGNWTSGWTANGYRLIRYADAMLLLAECKAMTNDGDLGLTEVNAIRTRASNTAGFVREDDDSADAANYVIGVYGSFASQAEAMTAIKMERKLELGMEGHRYYDLQRWGDVESDLSRILAHEKTMEWGSALYGSASIGAEDVNFPVPQRQIDLGLGNIVQNR